MKENTTLVQKFSTFSYGIHGTILTKKYLKLKMSKFELRLRYQFENIITHVMVYTPYYNIIKFALVTTSSTDHLIAFP